MNAARAYADLLRFGPLVVTTDDAALRLRMKTAATTRMLGRLAGAGLVRRLRRGLWTLRPEIDPLLVPEHLVRPFPAYVSFQTALSLHGMISQIPHVIYVASLGRPQRVKTAVGTYSIHRLPPELFGGYHTTPSSVHLATPEKALLDVLYLANVRSRLFARLPEVDIPADFDARAARRWIGRIPSAARKAMVRRRLAALVAAPRRR